MADERDMDGRCGTCAHFVPVFRDASTGVASGDCRAGWATSTLPETAGCGSHVTVAQLRRGKPGASSARRSRGAPGRSRAPAAPARDPIPSEIGIDMDQDEFRAVLREVMLDELGVREVEMGDRWQGGKAVLVPGNEETQSREIPLDTLFRKVVLIREKLRVLEQKINGHPKLDDSDRLQLQQYITASYGSLTTFNVLFRERDDGFKGAGT